MSSTNGGKLTRIDNQPMTITKDPIQGCLCDPLVKLKREQVGCCAICGKAKDLVVDHDHKSGLVRGLLCRICNTNEGRRINKHEPLFVEYRNNPPAKRLQLELQYGEHHVQKYTHYVSATEWLTSPVLHDPRQGDWNEPKIVANGNAKPIKSTGREIMQSLIGFGIGATYIVVTERGPGWKEFFPLYRAGMALRSLLTANPKDYQPVTPEQYNAMYLLLVQSEIALRFVDERLLCAYHEER